MLPQIIQFVIKHWVLCAAFVIISLVLIIEEIRSQQVTGGKVSSAQATYMMNREEAMIIDLRDAAAFREGHIIGAKNIPLADFDRHLDKLDPHRARPIILVDAMGMKTASIAARLIKIGFVHTKTLKGGMDGWKTDNMPIVKK